MRRGFTLVELLLVLAVVGVLALLAAPRLSDSLRGRRLRDQAQELVALARTARARAAGEGRTYLLLVDGEERTARLARRRDSLAPAGAGDDPELEAPDEAEAWSRERAFAQDVVLAEAEVGGFLWEEEGPVQVSFRPTGEADPARLVLEAGGERLVVTVTGPAGLARVQTEDEVEEDPSWW